MRIRKNAKLASLIYPQGSRPESVHVCQLNQSPWDVIPFAQEPHPSSSLHLQFEAEDSFNGNGSLGDSIGAVESIASMMEGEEKAIMKVEGMVIDDNDELKIAKQFGFKSQFEEEEKESRQEAMLKSCNNSCDSGNIPSSLTSKKAEKNIQLTGSRRGRARAAKKGSSSASNPYEFYYYSGFGPLWGKRRGGGGSDRAGEISKNIIEAKEFENNNSSATTTQNNATLSSSSQIENNEEFDYVDDEEDDDDENVDSGKKRMRKPIKARSLKSLM